MSSLFFGIRIRVQSDSLSVEWDVDAANESVGAAVATVLRVSFLCSPHCISSANASLITSLLRSNVSATSGVNLRHSSIRTLQRSEWACLHGVATWAFEFVDVILGDSFHLVSCSFNTAMAGIGIGSTRMSALCTVHVPSIILQSSPITFLKASLSHLFCDSQSFDFTSSEYIMWHSQ